MARKPRHKPAEKAKPVLVREIVEAMEHLAPTRLAQNWDNVGLLAGDPNAPAGSVMLCIDLTGPVLAEAIDAGCGTVVAYHPPIFKPLGRLVADSGGPDGLVWQAVRAGLAIYSPHTALDAAPGGTNDVIAQACGLTGVEPFEYLSSASDTCKVVTFVPASAADHLADAMAAFGAGHIGNYLRCSFRSEGQGTFHGTPDSDPRIGRRGRLERVPELRLEMVAPRRRLPEVINALLQAHPYEEPAYDIYPLESAGDFGIGRVGALPEGTTLASLARKLRRFSGSQVMMIVGEADRPLRRAAVCVGSAGRLPFEKPRSADCDVVVTGEIRHHDALTIRHRGVCAVAMGHWESERPVLPVLAQRLSGMLASVKVLVSTADRGPFERQ